ncbi:Uu.00g106060.m01.CDS01 [Anthostomella pinea]|uniref:Uu.00g106060.m01.CDS01 n=1 Tax=Anthostomella pinea TaxID=933095 RepID=A0AAI8VE07_9PEZI|nr:Uu.00g106060.m01.CDS01 [Anthostomella pinea]
MTTSDSGRAAPLGPFATGDPVARLLAKNLESQKKESLQNMASFRAKPLTDMRTVAAKTESERVRLRDAWTLYFAEVHQLNANEIWI